MFEPKFPDVKAGDKVVLFRDTHPDGIVTVVDVADTHCAEGVIRVVTESGMDREKFTQKTEWAIQLGQTFSDACLEHRGEEVGTVWHIEPATVEVLDKCVGLIELEEMYTGSNEAQARLSLFKRERDAAAEREEEEREASREGDGDDFSGVGEW